MPHPMPVTTVSELPAGLEFVSDTQVVAAVREHLGDGAQDYDSFFVAVGDGDYLAAWGMLGIVPRDWKHVYRIL